MCHIEHVHGHMAMLGQSEDEGGLKPSTDQGAQKLLTYLNPTHGVDRVAEEWLDICMSLDRPHGRYISQDRQHSY